MIIVIVLVLPKSMPSNGIDNVIVPPNFKIFCYSWVAWSRNSGGGFTSLLLHTYNCLQCVLLELFFRIVSFSRQIIYGT